MKTVTVRIDDGTYNLLIKAAAGEGRTLSNFIKHAAVHYVASQSTATDEEMAAILKDESPVSDLRKGLKEARETEKSPYELGQRYLGKYESGMTDRSVNHRELIRQKLRPGFFKL